MWNFGLFLFVAADASAADAAEEEATATAEAAAAAAKAADAATASAAEVEATATAEAADAATASAADDAEEEATATAEAAYAATASAADDAEEEANATAEAAAAEIAPEAALQNLQGAGIRTEILRPQTGAQPKSYTHPLEVNGHNYLLNFPMTKTKTKGESIARRGLRHRELNADFHSTIYNAKIMQFLKINIFIFCYSAVPDFSNLKV